MSCMTHPLQHHVVPGCSPHRCAERRMIAHGVAGSGWKCDNRALLVVGGYEENPRCRQH